MTKGRDTHYQPWLRDDARVSKNADAKDSMGQASERPPLGLDLARYHKEMRERQVDLPDSSADAIHKPGRNPGSHEAGASPAIPGDTVAPLPTGDREKTWVATASDASKKSAAILKSGWNGFADWTIKLGQKADIPTKVSAMQLDEKAKSAAKSVSIASKQAANKTAQASKIAAAKTAESVARLELGEKFGGVAGKAGDIVKQGAATVVDATKAASETVVDATKSSVESVAKAGADLARKPSLDPAAIPSALDQLLAEEAAMGSQDSDTRRTAPQAATAPTLPLFAELPETVPAQQAVPKRIADASPPAHAPLPKAGPLIIMPGESDTRVHSVAEPTMLPARPDNGPSPATKRWAETRERIAQRWQNVRSTSPALDNGPKNDTGTTPLLNGSIAYAAIGGMAIAGALWFALSTLPPKDLEQQIGSASSPPLAAAGIDRADRADIEAIVHDYILTHPEIVPQAMERYQSQQMAKQIDGMRTELETPFAGAWSGAAKGDVTLVEFSDFACGYCRASVADVERLVKEDANLKVVHRELPILSSESGVAAKTALAAAKQGKYRAYYLAQFALGRPSPDTIKAAAAKANLDTVAAQKALLNEDIQAEIDKNMKIAQELSLSGTPSFIVGNRILQGAVGYEELKKAVDEARAQ